MIRVSTRPTIHPARTEFPLSVHTCHNTLLSDPTLFTVPNGFYLKFAWGLEPLLSWELKIPGFVPEILQMDVLRKII